MKYLVLFAVLVVVIGVWRHRREPAAPQQRRTGSPPPAQDMVACAHCGLHFPRADAIVQHGRTYCCADHLRAGSL